MKLLKSLYQSIPFKRPMFSVLKSFVKLPPSIYQHLHFVGNIKVDVDASKSFKIRHYGYQVENSIFWSGVYEGWEKVSLSIWAELSAQSQVIIDVGANTGVYALLAETINPKAQVIAFEPVERVFDKLVYNQKLNSYKMQCVPKALSNFDGEATIYDKDSEHTYSVTINADLSDDKETSIPTTIQTIRLDTFIETEKLPKIDLMKVDVETHEVEALEGFGKYLELYQPTFIIEILNVEIAAGLEKLVSSIGYNYYIIDENSGIKQLDHLTKSDYFNFLFCKPEIAAGLQSVKKFSSTYRNVS